MSTYSHERYGQLIHEVIDKIEELSSLKGGEYAGDTDRLANFRRNGAALGLPMESIWAVYAAKHWDAIMQYIRDQREGKERQRLEPIDGRVHDLIVYCILLLAMLDEAAEQPKAPSHILARLSVREYIDNFTTWEVFEEISGEYTVVYTLGGILSGHSNVSETAASVAEAVNKCTTEIKRILDHFYAK